MPGINGMRVERVRKEEWLQKALDYVLEHGVFGMTPARLAQALGTSRSSYYWHFGNMDDFRDQVVDYWITEYNDAVAAEMARVKSGPVDRFRYLLKRIQESGINRYEGAVHALAYGSERLMQKIQQAYRVRLEVTRHGLQEAGTEEGQVEALARMIICYLTWEAEMGFSETTKLANLKDRLVLDLIASAEAARPH